MRNQALLVVTILVALPITAAHATEICGNGIDDDANNMVDEGCYPAVTTGQCESPLSCEDTGMVSPSTGSLHYSLPPDISPGVPYGPNVGMRRFYLSQYSPGAGAPVWKKPMGDRWHHTYQTWLEKTGTIPSAKIVLHTNRGQDVLASYTSTASGWDYYNAFQTGAHYQFLRQRATTPFDYQLRLLTGETLTYNSAGRLNFIADTLATPNYVQMG